MGSSVVIPMSNFQKNFASKIFERHFFTAKDTISQQGSFLKSIIKHFFVARTEVHDSKLQFFSSQWHQTELKFQNLAKDRK
jgi:hypothetical protein